MRRKRDWKPSSRKANLRRRARQLLPPGHPMPTDSRTFETWIRRDPNLMLREENLLAEEDRAAAEERRRKEAGLTESPRPRRSLRPESEPAS